MLLRECTPIFGSENQPELGDIWGWVSEGAGGVGAIFTGLDMMNDYWSCLQRLENEYFRSLDALIESLQQCFWYMHCYLAGW